MNDDDDERAAAELAGAFVRLQAGMYYRLDGTQITDAAELGDVLMDPARLVAETTVDTPDGPGVVSTVFFPINHRYFEPGPPLLWETAIFTHDAVRVIAHYSSRDAAVIGHDSLVAEYRNAAGR